MKPRICYKCECNNTTRYTFLYPDAEGYKNWKWTAFDFDLHNIIEEKENGFSIVSHIEQPIQVNGRSFFDGFKRIFDNENIFKKDLNQKESLCGISKLLSMLSFKRILYLGLLNKKNKNSFFSYQDFGCFWYVFILKDKSYLKNFLSLINIDNINEDRYFCEDDNIPCILYRDYLNNRISIISNNNNITDCIENHIRKEKIFVVNKKINNIFDTAYIDNLSEKSLHK